MTNKHTTRIANWPGAPDQRLLDTEYVIRATHDEMHNHWNRWHRQHGFPLEEISMGLMRTIGTLAESPIVVSVFWYRWARHLVGYVEATSLIVDYGLVDDWIGDAFPNLKMTSDATNVGNILSNIGARDDLNYWDTDRERAIEALLRAPLKYPHGRTR